jgi:hypothetical protein
MKPAVKSAVEEMIPLLHDMTILNLDSTFEKIDEIRKSLDNEQDELEVISLLITIGEI